jgi:hypothetical protein
MLSTVIWGSWEGQAQTQRRRVVLRERRDRSDKVADGPTGNRPLHAPQDAGVCLPLEPPLFVERLEVGPVVRYQYSTGPGGRDQLLFIRYGSIGSAQLVDGHRIDASPA